MEDNIMEKQRTPLSERKRSININTLSEEQFEQLIRTVTDKVNSIIDNAKKESKSILDPLGMDFLLLVKIGTKEEMKKLMKSSKEVIKPKPKSTVKKNTVRKTKKHNL